MILTDSTWSGRKITRQPGKCMDVLIKNLKACFTCFCLAALLLASPLLMAQETDAEPDTKEPDSLVIERIERERAALRMQIGHYGLVFPISPAHLRAFMTQIRVPMTRSRP